MRVQVPLPAPFLLSCPSFHGGYISNQDDGYFAHPRSHATVKKRRMKLNWVSRTGGLAVLALLCTAGANRDVTDLNDFDEGLRLLQLSHHDKALLAFDRALVTRPDDPRIHYHRGVTLHGPAARQQAGLTRAGDERLTQANAAYARSVDLGSEDARGEGRVAGEPERSRVAERGPEQRPGERRTVGIERPGISRSPSVTRRELR